MSKKLFYARGQSDAARMREPNLSMLCMLPESLDAAYRRGYDDQMFSSALLGISRYVKQPKPISFQELCERYSDRAACNLTCVDTEGRGMYGMSWKIEKPEPAGEEIAAHWAWKITEAGPDTVVFMEQDESGRWHEVQK